MPKSENRLEGPVSGLRVVECGDGVAAAFAAKLLANLGADVVKVETPDGDSARRRGPFPGDAPDPEKSALFVYLNAGKRGVVLDLLRPEGRERLARLLGEADVLLHDIPPHRRATLGLEPSALLEAHPRLVVTSISPFGDDGPRRDWRAHEVTVANAGGWAYLSPGGLQNPELPPLKCSGQQAYFQGGVHAAMVSLAAYRHRLRSGRGQAVDVSMQEAIAAMLEMNFMHWSYAGRETSRLGQRLLAPWKILECAEGWVHIICVEEAQWQRLVEFMGNPEWAGEEIFADRLARGRNSDALYALMHEWIAKWKAQDLYHAAQKQRIPVAALSTMRDLYENVHLRERSYFVRIEQPGMSPFEAPGAPTRYGAGGWALRGPAPRLGEHDREIFSGSPWRPAARPEEKPGQASAGDLPLSGIRILDFTWAWAGPFAMLQLAHLGAEVIRVESEKRLCVTRGIPPFADNQPGPNRAGYFNQYNQGKRSITLDLSNPRAIDVARELVRHCDVVADNFAAGVMDRLGLGYETLRRERPDLIMISMSGYGQTGPFRQYVSYGPPAAATAGFYTATGYVGGGPEEIGISYADPNAGIFGALAVLVALHHRWRTGEGQYIDQSQLETAIAVLPEPLLDFAVNGREPERIGNRDRWMAPHGCYKTKGDQDKWVAIAVGSEEEWHALCRAIGRPELAGDPRFATSAERKRNEDELDRVVEAWTRERDRWEAAEQLQREGVAAFPSMSNKDLATDPHLRDRGYLVELEHPEVGRRIHAGIPWRMSGTPCRVRAAGPLRGADTDAVLRDVLGWSDSRIAELRNSGVLA